MNSRDLNRWMREEHGKVDELTRRLAERIAYLPRQFAESWIKDLTERFEHLRAHLMKHIALEEKDGYMLPVLERVPSLGDEVERLRREHRDLLDIMQEIHERLATLSPERPLLARDCCERLRNLLDYIAEHERQEDIMMISAFTDEYGAAD